MRALLARFKWPVILSALLVLPFMVMEWINRREYGEDYPVGLFIIMWLLPVVFIYSLAAIIRGLQEPSAGIWPRVGRLLWLALAILMIWLWAGTVNDQMPCFLGVPVCD
ncbi:hypothetical protein FDZ74_10130 [bacterium]|nr:MAG: hypothetical protein FDZ74_10130 [bacterium]